MCLFQIPLIYVTVAPLLMPDYPTPMSISATMWLSSSLLHLPCYLQDRDEIADDVIIVKSRNRRVKVTVISVHPLTVQSGISSRATIASIKASIHTRFVFSHARALGISHYWKPHSSLIQDILPVSYCDATVRTAFMPDSTLGFFQFLSV